MTLAEARTDLLAQSSLDSDLYIGQTLDGEGNAIAEITGLTDLLSRACQWWAKLTYCCEDHNVALTLVVDQTTPYDCRSLSVVSKKILTPRVVVINDTALYRRDGKKHGLWTIHELQRAYPTWRTADHARPFVAIWQTDDKLRLWPKTDALYTGKNFIDAWTIPSVLDPLVDEDAELPVPEEDHPSIIRLAAVFGSLPNLSDGEAWQRAGTMDGWWREQAQRRKTENVSKYLGRVPRGAAAYQEWMY